MKGGSCPLVHNDTKLEHLPAKSKHVSCQAQRDVRETESHSNSSPGCCRLIRNFSFYSQAFTPLQFSCFFHLNRHFLSTFDALQLLLLYCFTAQFQLLRAPCLCLIS